MTPRYRYAPYESTESTPNVVVDGSANAATVLTLSHWPGAPTPPHLLRDLSAQIAFAYLDDPIDHPPAEVVTNNHFDQDGLVSITALVHPDEALEHRDLLIDVAAAGDFGTYLDRRAARASMVIAAWAAQGLDYAETIDRLVPLAVDPEPYRDLWAEEDALLAAGEEAIALGAITIEEQPELDLAIVTVHDDRETVRSHRFAHRAFVGSVHPMALHNATDRFRLLIVHGRRYQLVDRYETWVQYQSRPTLPRTDLRLLAERLTELDSVAWTADAPGALAPELAHTGESVVPVDELVEAVTDHLRDAVPIG